jgi:hypothetical protein
MLSYRDKWDGCALSVPIPNTKPSTGLCRQVAHFGISLGGSASAERRCIGIGRPTFPEKGLLPNLQGLLPNLHLRSAGPASGSGLWGLSS